MKGFKQFVLRGNVVDLAVGIVIGTAFGSVVAAFVKDLLTPLITAIAGKPDFSALTFTINHSQFLYGDFINTIIALLLVSAAVYYFVVLPMNALIARVRHEPAAGFEKRACPECKSEISMEARRCPFCTSSIASVSQIGKTGT